MKAQLQSVYVYGPDYILARKQARKKVSNHQSNCNGNISKKI